LIGLFTEQDYLWMPDLENLQTGGGNLMGLMSLKHQVFPGQLAQSGGGCDGPVAEAMDQQLMDYPVIISDLLQQGANLNSDTMADLMNQYNDLAFAYTELCKNEKGKSALLRILSANQLLGLEFGNNWAYDPSRVIDKIKDLSREIAQKALVEGKCIDIPEALHALREAQLLGVAQEPLFKKDPESTEDEAESIEEAIRRRVDEWGQECDLWRGSIIIFHFPAGSHPGLTALGDDRTSLISGNPWTEIHDVRISTHPKTHAITGRSKVKLMFPPIMYSVNSHHPDACNINDLIVFYGIPSEQMEVTSEQENYDNSKNSENQVDPDLIENYEAYMKDPQSLTSEQIAELAEYLEGSGDLASQPAEDIKPADDSSQGSYDLEYGFDITFGGFYDGMTFSISDLEYNCYATIFEYIHQEDQEDYECIVGYDQTIPVYNYSSYLEHGLYDSPPITLQEILEAPPTGGDFEIIRGSEKFSNPHPEIGSYPFNTTQVIWDIIHVQNQDIK